MGACCFWKLMVQYPLHVLDKFNGPFETKSFLILCFLTMKEYMCQLWLLSWQANIKSSYLQDHDDKTHNRYGCNNQ